MEQQFIDYVKNTIWQDDTDDLYILSMAEKVFNEMKQNKSKLNYMYRICGQSGSGKTTQLMASIEKVLSEKGLNPVVIAVRNFAKYHPKYESLLNEYGKGQIREKTNGFALKLLGAILSHFIKNGYLIVMDVTLLDIEFEKLIISLTKQNNYQTEFHIMSVPRAVSDMFIQKRQQSKTSKEGERVVYKSSSNFFYEILPISLKYLTKNMQDSLTFIWSAFHFEPVYAGNMHKCFKTFEEYRTYENFEFLDESILMHKKVLCISKNTKVCKN